MKKIIIFFILLLISVSLIAQNQNILTVKSNQKRIKINNEYIEIYKDLNKKLTFKEISSDSFVQFNSCSNFDEKLKINTNYWLKFQIKNITDEKGNWTIEFQSIPILDIYILDKTGKVEKFRAGTQVSASEKQMELGIRENINFTLQANEIKTIYVKILLDIDIETVNFISISDSKTYNKQALIDNLIQGIFHGLLWMMLFYNLFLFISTRKKSYLFYVAYVFFFSLFQLQMFGYIKNFILPENPLIALYFEFSFLIAFIFYYLLMREFIDSKNKHSKLDKFLKITILINLIFTIILFIITLLNNNFSYFATLLFILLNMITLLVVNIIILIQGNKISKIFAIGTSVLVLGTLIIIIGTILGANSENTIYYFQAGIVGQIFIFSLGLSYKYKVTEQQRQKAQDNLILQLKENQQLQTKVNRELEQKVKERTAEINEQKAEIQTIADNLLEANTEIQSIADNLSDANVEINKKNENITASIQYAKRIQTAMLPDEPQISKILSKYFILFKPRDIISGDFYWFKKIDENLIIAAADCTGHGVPGAFVSMLGISLLNEIVRKKEITKANQVLEQLRKHIKISLKQTKDEDSSKDGMDIAFCVINTQTLMLQYAGAYNPLYIVRNNELLITQATRSPIGIYIKELSFTNNEIQLQKHDKIYIFTDGYVDQFGGENGNKFMSKKFKQLILKIANKPFNEQKQILDTTIENWKKDREQNDDMLIIGFEAN